MAKSPDFLNQVTTLTYSYPNNSKCYLKNLKKNDYSNLYLHLLQIPPGYCFSPLYSPSKPDNMSEVSSNKGNTTHFISYCGTNLFSFKNTKILISIYQRF